MAIMHMQQSISAVLRFGATLEEPLRRITHREQLRDIQSQSDIRILHSADSGIC